MALSKLNRSPSNRFVSCWCPSVERRGVLKPVAKLSIPCLLPNELAHSDSRALAPGYHAERCSHGLQHPRAAAGLRGVWHDAWPGRRVARLDSVFGLFPERGRRQWVD